MVYSQEQKSSPVVIGGGTAADALKLGDSADYWVWIPRIIFFLPEVSADSSSWNIKRRHQSPLAWGNKPRWGRREELFPLKLPQSFLHAKWSTFDQLSRFYHTQVPLLLLLFIPLRRSHDSKHRRELKGRRSYLNSVETNISSASQREKSSKILSERLNRGELRSFLAVAPFFCRRLGVTSP